MKKTIIFSIVSLFCMSLLLAQKTKEEVLKKLDTKNEIYTGIAQSIWNYAETRKNRAVLYYKRL